MKGTKDVEWKEFDDYWHIGQAQILSRKINESDFRRNIKSFIESLLARQREEFVDHLISYKGLLGTSFDAEYLDKLITKYKEEPTNE